jgi:hypothetical protein
MRVLLTLAVLVLLAGLLWWAVGSLGDGFGAIFDLLRGEPEGSPGGPQALPLILAV